MARYTSLSRRLLGKKLTEVMKDIRTPILDIGAGKKTRTYSTNNYPDYVTLDINPATEPDIVADLTAPLPKEMEARFETVLCNQVLEHVKDFRAFIKNMHLTLKPGGVCIVSVPFIYKVHYDPVDYWRYTDQSLKELFKEFDQVTIRPYGGRLSASWLIIANGKLRILQKLNPLIERLDRENSSYPLGYVVKAVKKKA